jgi:lysyl-tRNA synthetase class II
MAARRVVPLVSMCTADFLQLRQQRQQIQKTLLQRSNLWNGSSSSRLRRSCSSSSCKQQQGMRLRPVQASISASSPAKHQEAPNALPLPEQQQWVSRTHLCGSLTEANEGERVRICGWVASHRSHGNLTFVNLRDHTGIVQVFYFTSWSSDFILCIIPSQEVRPYQRL